MSVSIKDIAKYTGLSASTVSKALNDYKDIPDTTKAKVMKAAMELGYHASSSARSLRLRRTEKIGLMISTQLSMTNITGEYYFEAIRGVAFASEKRDYNVILYTTIGDNLEKARKICSTREIDGLIITGGGNTESLVDICNQYEIPVVVLNRRMKRKDLRLVCSDNVSGGYKAVSHLAEIGRKRIAFIGRSDDRETTEDRYEGYRTALADHSLSLDESLVRYSDYRQEHIAEAVEDLLGASGRPDAVFAFNDRIAIEVLAACKRKNLSVPGDIALAGYDNIRSSLVTSPPLTTVTQNLFSIGEKSVELLIDAIAKKETEETQIILPVDLVVRESTVTKS